MLIKVAISYGIECFEIGHRPKEYRHLDQIRDSAATRLEDSLKIFKDGHCLLTNIRSNRIAITIYGYLT
ncbi:hypothetical protein DFP86_106214 [Paludibacterium purpuratum]|uniref:Uncharacterized protein n=1 Tax=Paludibacterium purpuratum TaxID=1144873 RepID=A0A4R7B614_9NEIS|nr:hypothetical protein DFP86_106214 [Paludibacterium purpuratum]